MEIKYEAVFGNHKFSNDTCEIAMRSSFDEIIEMRFTKPLVIPEGWGVIAMRRIIKTPVQHSDDIAVDLFATKMKEKLCKSRDKGRSGWEACPVEYLIASLKDHISKGDPVDVANFAMMISQRGESIKTPTWTVADQKAGKLPEVGAKCRQGHKEETVIAVTENFVVTECLDGAVCTTRKCEFMASYNPIETPEERAQRLEDEFFEQVKLGGMNANTPQKTSSLFELGVRAAYRKYLELTAPKGGE